MTIPQTQARALIKHYGSVAQAAVATGINLKTLGHYSTGHRSPGSDNRRKLSVAAHALAGTKRKTPRKKPAKRKKTPRKPVKTQVKGLDEAMLETGMVTQPAPPKHLKAALFLLDKFAQTQNSEHAMAARTLLQV